MTVHKLSAGDGYSYLTSQVASADLRRERGQGLTDYYQESGNPPGRWLGSGAAGLGVEGEVSEAQMKALFGAGLHPDAERIVAHAREAGVGPQRAQALAQLGRRYPEFRALPDRGSRIAARLAALPGEPAAAEAKRIREEETARERQPVAGYDLVFTPVKSASVLWGLGDERVRNAVEAAHHEAVAQTVEFLEEHAAFTRLGAGGVEQVDTHGLTCAAFDHRDSRTGDPNLHTHLVVANKVRARRDHNDGTPRWVSLDGRALFAVGVAASERYNTRFEDALARRLGVTFSDRDGQGRNRRPVREIDGVPPELIRHFATRRAAIEDRYTELLAAYRDEHDREPSQSAQLRLAQQATLETRDAKAPAHSTRPRTRHRAAPPGPVRRRPARRRSRAEGDGGHAVLGREQLPGTATVAGDESARPIGRVRGDGDAPLDRAARPAGSRRVTSGGPPTGETRVGPPGRDGRHSRQDGEQRPEQPHRAETVSGDGAPRNVGMSVAADQSARESRRDSRRRADVLPAEQQASRGGNPDQNGRREAGEERGHAELPDQADEFVVTEAGGPGVGH